MPVRIVMHNASKDSNVGGESNSGKDSNAGIGSNDIKDSTACTGVEEANMHWSGKTKR